MSLDKNKAITSRFWEEVFNGRNLDLIANLVTEDYVFHGSAGKEVRGREGLKQFLSMFFNAVSGHPKPAREGHFKTGHLK